jgi:hypothetical protein
VHHTQKVYGTKRGCYTGFTESLSFHAVAIVLTQIQPIRGALSSDSGRRPQFGIHHAADTDDDVRNGLDVGP